MVLKTAAGVDHKTDAGGVMVGIDDEPALTVAYREMSARLGPKVMLAEQVPAGVELALGMIVDDQFGPVVIVSAGGRLIELLEDRVALLPPFDRSVAIHAIDRLRIRPLLDGYRTAPPADIDRLVDVVIRFAELAMDAAVWISAIDVNPVIAGPDQAVAVDALMTPS